MQAPSPFWLKVCVTCDRSHRLAPGEQGHGAQLAEHVAAVLKDQDVGGNIALRRVPCLSGCKHPGNIAVGAMGRASIRFHDLGVKSAVAVVEMAKRFLARGDCLLNDGDIPEELNGHVAAMILPH
jgi:predicted metal-binding protein